jgi:hypothetical protein
MGAESTMARNITKRKSRYRLLVAEIRVSELSRRVSIKKGGEMVSTIITITAATVTTAIIEAKAKRTVTAKGRQIEKTTMLPPRRKSGVAA